MRAALTQALPASKRKGISSTMEIIIALVVILVAALVILSIFGIQIPGITGPIQGTTEFAACQTTCAQLCFQNPGVNQGDINTKGSCKIQFICNCQSGVPTTPAGGGG